MSDIRLNTLGDSVVRDFGFAFCGAKLGAGIGREVYECAIDPSKVVKIETASQSFQNVIEWETWHRLKDGPHGKWLAPCRFISP